MIRMHHIIARSKLVQFFQGKGHLSRTGFITLQIILMETVENLMVGEKARLEVVVSKPGMQSTVHGSKVDTRSLFRENGSQPIGLFGRIGQYI